MSTGGRTEPSVLPHAWLVASEVCLLRSCLITKCLKIFWDHDDTARFSSGKSMPQISRSVAAERVPLYLGSVQSSPSAMVMSVQRSTIYLSPSSSSVVASQALARLRRSTRYSDQRSDPSQVVTHDAVSRSDAGDRVEAQKGWQARDSRRENHQTGAADTPNSPRPVKPAGCRRESPSWSDSSTRSLVEAVILRL